MAPVAPVTRAVVPAALRGQSRDRLRDQRCSRPAPTPSRLRWRRRLLANMGEDSWRSTCTTPSGSDWLGDQDAIEYLVRNARRHLRQALGRSLLAHRGRQDLSASFRRHDHPLRQGLSPSAPAPPPDRTGHAILHTLCGHSLRYRRSSSSSISPSTDHGCRQRLPRRRGLCLGDGTLHRFRAQKTILAAGGCNRACFSCTSALFTGDGGGMVLRASLRAGHVEFDAVPPDRHLRRNSLITEARARRDGYLTNSAGERFVEPSPPRPRTRLRATSSISPWRSAKAVASARTRITSTCTSSPPGSRDPGRGICQASPRSAKIFAGVIP